MPMTLIGIFLINFLFKNQIYQIGRLYIKKIEVYVTLEV